MFPEVSGRSTETPKEKANKLRELFEILRRNLERASQDQAMDTSGG